MTSHYHVCSFSSTSNILGQSLPRRMYRRHTLGRTVWRQRCGPSDVHDSRYGKWRANRTVIYTRWMYELRSERARKTTDPQNQKGSSLELKAIRLLASRCPTNARRLSTRGRSMTKFMSGSAMPCFFTVECSTALVIELTNQCCMDKVLRFLVLDEQCLN